MSGGYSVRRSKGNKMMFNNKAVIAVKVNGKVLREFKDTVYIPFGSEYSILLKNLNTKRAIFTVHLDGDDVAPGGIILNAGQEVNLERWIKNGNLSEGNKFKFIERTSTIEDHRGISLEDGLIRVEYQFEIDRPVSIPMPYYVPVPYKNPPYPKSAPNYPYDYWNKQIWHDTWTGNSTSSDSDGYSIANGSISGIFRGSESTSASLQASSMAAANNVSATYTNDVGITVPGSKSEQKFTTVSNFALETTKHSMVLRLLGETLDNKPIIAPVTVKTKQKCVTCGKHNKATSKFCASCGTSLTIYA